MFTIFFFAFVSETELAAISNYQCLCGDEGVNDICPPYPRNCGKIWDEEFCEPVTLSSSRVTTFPTSEEFISLFQREWQCDCEYNSYGYLRKRIFLIVYFFSKNIVGFVKLYDAFVFTDYNLSTKLVVFL